MKLAGKTDKGGYRSENQDNYRAARLPDDTVWAVVCDGMGGAAAGQLASQVATDALEDCFAEGLKNLPEGGEPCWPGASPRPTVRSGPSR